MKLIVALASFAALAAQPAGAQGWSDKVPEFQRSAEKTIEMWPRDAKRAAKVITEKYGKPTETAADSLIWYGNGPWKRTVVRSKKEFVANTVGYLLPASKMGDLAKFSADIIVDPSRAELTAASGSEALNFLNLNLADEVIKGTRTPEEALLARDRILKLADAGKESSYMKDILFETTF